MITFGSLFAGAGGFDLGLEKASMRCLWQCELDKNCQKLLRTRWPHAKLHDDINTFNPDEFECPHVICFGSPCQDLSVAGLRAGIRDGERSNLFFVAAGIIRKFARRGLEFAVWEQVPGVFSSNGGRDFAAVLREMAKCGAVDVGWRVLDAQYQNVAQRRERVFLVVDFRAERAAEILSLADGLSWHPAPSRETRERVAGTISARTKGGGGLGTDFELGGGIQVTHSLTHDGFDAGEDGTGRGTPLIPEASYCLSARASMDRLELNTAPMMGVRRLTPLECLRLMSWPDDHFDGLGFADSTKYKACGNGVVSNVAEWIGKRIVKALAP